MSGTCYGENSTKAAGIVKMPLDKSTCNTPKE